MDTQDFEIVNEYYVPIDSELKHEVFERDNYTCQSCGIVGESGLRKGNIQAHHKVPYRAGGENELSNLITLCVECHKKADLEWHRGNRKRYFESMEKEEKKPTSFYLPSEDKDLLKSISKKLGISQTSVVEIAIRRLAEVEKIEEK